jgi:hypothetical protein
LKIKVKNLDAVELVSCYTLLSKVHIEEKNFDKSLENINKAITIIEANPMFDFTEQHLLYYYLGLINLLSTDKNIKKSI